MGRVIVLSDVIVPERIIFVGVKGRLERVNRRTRSQGGDPMVAVVRPTLRRFTLGVIPLLISDWLEIEGLYEITEAGAYGMLMSDPKDAEVMPGQGFLRGFAGNQFVGAAGQGYGVPVVKMFQRKTSIGTTRTYDRRITRPQASSVLYRNGTPLVVGIAAGNITRDDATGSATFVPDASQSIQSITVGATTVLNFGNGTVMVAAMSVGQRVYLSGIDGTAATRLNGVSHNITAKGATSLTIALNTSGLTATGGLAAKYPQATDLLTWDGPFYTPVQFQDDFMDWDMLRSGPMDHRLINAPTVTLIEIPEP